MWRYSFFVIKFTTNIHDSIRIFVAEPSKLYLMNDQLVAEGDGKVDLRPEAMKTMQIKRSTSLAWHGKYLSEKVARVAGGHWAVCAGA